MKKLILLMLIQFLWGCKPTKLNFDADQFYQVKEILKSANCKVSNCHNEASCENKTIKLTGELHPDTFDFEHHHFYIYDTNNDDYYLEVKIEPAITQNVQSLIQDKNSIKIEAVIKGYPAQTNFTCDRNFYLTITNLDQIIID